jgi:hypothetical protein
VPNVGLCCSISAKAMVQALLLRHNSVHNAHIDAHWTTSLLFSLIQELVDCYDSSEDKFNGLGQPFVLTTIRYTDKSRSQSAKRVP